MEVIAKISVIKLMLCTPSINQNTIQLLIEKINAG